MLDQLTLAVESGRTDVVKSFLSTLQQNESQNESIESDISLTQILHEACFDGETLLHMASKKEKIDIVRALLSSGADPSVRDSDGSSAYHVAPTDTLRKVFNEILLQAASQSNLAQVKQLIRAGVDLNFCDTVDTGNTPLHWVASFANTEMAEYLCAHGGEVNACNTSGSAPLHDAIVRGNRDIVYTLLKYGADPTVQITLGKFSGKTAYDLAEEKPEILAVLKNPPPIQIAVPPPPQTADTDSYTQTGVADHVPSTDTAQLSSPLANGDVRHDVTAAKASPIHVYPQLMSPTFKRAPGLDEVQRPPQVVTEEKLGLLWPQPQTIVQTEGPAIRLCGTVPVYVTAGTGSALREIKKKWLLFTSMFDQLGVHLAIEPFTSLSDLEEPHIMCHVSRRLCPGKGRYKITIMQKQLKVLCCDCDSLHFAVSTLLQLCRSYKEEYIEIPQLMIEDWPSLPYRGVLLDISQGRVPNVETFKEMIKTLSMMKINQLQVYTRFRSVEHLMWQIIYRPDELSELDETCHEYGIQLCPVLEVAPAVQYDDIPQLYPVFQDFLSCFSFNEFVSVGPRLSSFLLDVGEDGELSTADCATLLPIRSDQTLQVCGYPLHDASRRLLPQLPPELVLNEYGVQASHDFFEFCRPLAKHGVSFFVCPGTGAWNSLAGCPEAALTNVYNAVKCAASEDALGLLVCNWSGKGHITHLPFCWPGFLMGAGLSWNSDSHWEYLLGNLEELLNLHVFCQEKGVLGHAIVELGRAETYLLRCSKAQAGDDCSELPPDQGSLLYQFLLQPDSTAIERLTPEMLQRVTRHVRKCQTELKDLELSCPQGASIVAELQHTCDLMLLSAKIGRALVVSGKNPNPGGQAGYDVVNLGISNLSATVKTDLANRLLELIEVYEKLWKDRYLEHGLKFSVTALWGLIKQLIPDNDPQDHEDTQD